MVPRRGFHADRLNGGDRLNVAASLGLLVVLVAFAWFGGSSVWASCPALGALSLLVCVLGLGAGMLVGSRRSPAVGVVVTIIEAPLAGVVLVWLAWRVLLSAPARPDVAAYAALALGLLIVVGVYRSLRHEGVAGRDAQTEADTIAL